MKKRIFIAVLPLLFAACSSKPAAEEQTKQNYAPTTEVVARVEMRIPGSGAAVESEKLILTESGKVLSAYYTQKGFFLQEGDTLSLQGNKIVHIRLKK